MLKVINPHYRNMTSQTDTIDMKFKFMALQWLLIVTEAVTIAKNIRTFLTMKFSFVHLLYI